MCVVIKSAFANIIQQITEPGKLGEFKKVLDALVRDTMSFPSGRTYQTAKYTGDLVACASHILIHESGLEVCLGAAKCFDILVDTAIHELLGEDFLATADALVKDVKRRLLPRVEKACLEIGKATAAEFNKESIPVSPADFHRILGEVPGDAPVEVREKLVAAVRESLDMFAELKGHTPDIDTIVDCWSPVEALEKLTIELEKLKYSDGDKKVQDAIALFNTNEPPGFSAAIEAKDFDGLAACLDSSHWAALPQAFAAARAVVKPLLADKQLTKEVQTIAQEFLTEGGPGVLATMACVQSVNAGNLSKKAITARLVSRGWRVREKENKEE